MANSSSFDPSELAEALSHASDTHGTNLFRAMNTSAFSRLPLTDQVEVVKSFADRLPEEAEEQAKQKPNFSDTSSKALSGLRRGAQVGALIGTGNHFGSLYSRGLSKDEKAYENQEFFSRRLPMSVGVGGVAGSISGALGSYRDAQKAREVQLSQIQKLRDIQREGEDKKRNMLALSMLSSMPHLASTYDTPRPKDPVEEWLGSPAKQVNEKVPSNKGKPDPDKVLKFQADTAERLADNHFRSKKEQ